MDLVWMILLSIIGAYFLVSLSLLIFPVVIHQNHSGKLSSVKTASHRGGAGEFIENTMAAFNNSVNLGIDLLEIDVQETADGVIVVSHDDDIYRCTGAKIKISETNYEELPCYKNNTFLQFDRVQCHSTQADFKFVILDDLFTKHKDIIIHIDTKEGNPSLIHKVSDLVEKHKRYGNTVWGNMSEAKNDLSYSTNPEIHMFMSIRKVAFTYVSFYLGFIGLVPMKEAVFDIPMPSAIGKAFGDHLSTFQKILVHIAQFLMMNRLVFWHLRRRGIKVIVFVLNNSEGFTLASQYNVDGIMTDFPSRLVEFYKEDNQDVRETSQILSDHNQ